LISGLPSEQADFSHSISRFGGQLTTLAIVIQLQLRQYTAYDQRKVLPLMPADDTCN